MELDATQALDVTYETEDDEEKGEIRKKQVATLKVKHRKGLNKYEFPVFEGQNIIGRHEKADIYLPCKPLSKKHACIEVNSGQHFIFDYGSKNKTRRGKMVLRPNIHYELTDGSQLMFADVPCIYTYMEEVDQTDSISEDGSDSMLIPDDNMLESGKTKDIRGESNESCQEAVPGPSVTQDVSKENNKECTDSKNNLSEKSNTETPDDKIYAAETDSDSEHVVGKPLEPETPFSSNQVTLVKQTPGTLLRRIHNVSLNCTGDSTKAINDSIEASDISLKLDVTQESEIDSPQIPAERRRFTRAESKNSSSTAENVAVPPDAKNVTQTKKSQKPTASNIQQSTPIHSHKNKVRSDLSVPSEEGNNPNPGLLIQESDEDVNDELETPTSKVVPNMTDANQIAVSKQVNALPFPVIQKSDDDTDDEAAVVKDVRTSTSNSAKSAGNDSHGLLIQESDDEDDKELSSETDRIASDVSATKEVVSKQTLEQTEGCLIQESDNDETDVSDNEEPLLEVGKTGFFTPSLLKETLGGKSSPDVEKDVQEFDPTKGRVGDDKCQEKEIGASSQDFMLMATQAYGVEDSDEDDITGDEGSSGFKYVGSDMQETVKKPLAGKTVADFRPAVDKTKSSSKQGLPILEKEATTPPCYDSDQEADTVPTANSEQEGITLPIESDQERPAIPMQRETGNVQIDSDQECATVPMQVSSQEADTFPLAQECETAQLKSSCKIANTTVVDDDQECATVPLPSSDQEANTYPMDQECAILPFKNSEGPESNAAPVFHSEEHPRNTVLDDIKKGTSNASTQEALAHSRTATFDPDQEASTVQISVEGGIEGRPLATVTGEDKCFKEAGTASAGDSTNEVDSNSFKRTTRKTIRASLSDSDQECATMPPPLSEEEIDTASLRHLNQEYSVKPLKYSVSTEDNSKCKPDDVDGLAVQEDNASFKESNSAQRQDEFDHKEDTRKRSKAAKLDKIAGSLRATASRNIHSSNRGNDISSEQNLDADENTDDEMTQAYDVLPIKALESPMNMITLPGASTFTKWPNSKKHGINSEISEDREPQAYGFDDDVATQAYTGHAEIMPTGINASGNFEVVEETQSYDDIDVATQVYGLGDQSTVLYENKKGKEPETTQSEEADDDECATQAYGLLNKGTDSLVNNDADGAEENNDDDESATQAYGLLNKDTGSLVNNDADGAGENNVDDESATQDYGLLNKDTGSLVNNDADGAEENNVDDESATQDYGLLNKDTGSLVNNDADGAEEDSAEQCATQAYGPFEQPTIPYDVVPNEESLDNEETQGDECATQVYGLGQHFIRTDNNAGRMLDESDDEESDQLATQAYELTEQATVPYDLNPDEESLDRAKASEDEYETQVYGITDRLTVENVVPQEKMINKSEDDDSDEYETQVYGITDRLTVENVVPQEKMINKSEDDDSENELDMATQAYGLNADKDDDKDDDDLKYENETLVREDVSSTRRNTRSRKSAAKKIEPEKKSNSKNFENDIKKIGPREKPGSKECEKDIEEKVEKDQSDKAGRKRRGRQISGSETISQSETVKSDSDNESCKEEIVLGRKRQRKSRLKNEGAVENEPDLQPIVKRRSRSSVVKKSVRITEENVEKISEDGTNVGIGRRRARSSKIEGNTEGNETSGTLDENNDITTNRNDIIDQIDACAEEPLQEVDETEVKTASVNTDENTRKKTAATRKRGKKSASFVHVDKDEEVETVLENEDKSHRAEAGILENNKKGGSMDKRPTKTRSRSQAGIDTEHDKSTVERSVRESVGKRGKRRTTISKHVVKDDTEPKAKESLDEKGGIEKNINLMEAAIEIELEQSEVAGKEEELAENSGSASCSTEVSSTEEGGSRPRRTKNAKGKSPMRKSMSTRDSEEIDDEVMEKPKIMFTGLTDKSVEKSAIQLGAELADSIYEATHLVTDKVRRTVKFLCSLSRGIPIVGPHWLDACRKAKRFTDADEFTVKDKGTEKQYNFDLKRSILQARSEKLLEGYSVYATKNVKPDQKQMKDIILCCDGKPLPRLPKNLDDKTLIISCEEDKAEIKNVVNSGCQVYTAEILLTGILRQKLEPDLFKLEVNCNSAKRGAKRTQSKSELDTSKGTPKRRKR